jgi:hypothetical protein
MYKVNCEAAVDNKNKHIEFRIVVRDYEGVIVAARSTTEYYGCSCGS